MQIKSKKGEYLDILLRSKKTVFSTKDIALLWREENEGAARVRLRYYAKTGKLIRLRKGLYVKDKGYDRFELATRVYTPSYISFETVLARSGITFQYYETIFVASYVTREININGQTIAYVRINNDVLSNTAGVEHKDNYDIATKERAFLDRVYVSGDYHFDHLDPLDWNKVFELLPAYRNKRMAEKVNEYHTYYRSTK